MRSFLFQPTTKLICLVDVTLQQDEKNECIFVLTDPNKKNRKYTFKAKTVEECERWIEAIFDAIVESKNSGKGNSEACTLQ